MVFYGGYSDPDGPTFLIIGYNIKNKIKMMEVNPSQHVIYCSITKSSHNISYQVDCMITNQSQSWLNWVYKLIDSKL